MESNQEQNKLNSEMLEKLVNNQPPEEVLYEVAELFKVFGDSTRIRILYALFGNELCVGDIAEITNSTQSAISHQLRVLKQAKLVKFRKDGKTVYYSLDDEHVSKMYEIAKKHIEEGYEHRG